MAVTFRLTHVSFASISEHVRHRAGISLPVQLAAVPWVYLSNFYQALPHEQIAAGSLRPPQGATPTRLLKEALTRLPPHILCCEPVLGSDPRSISYKNIELSPDVRYAGLCQYYRRLGLTTAIPTTCTLQASLTQRGRIWSEPDRLFLFGTCDGAHQALPLETIPQGRAIAHAWGC